MPQPAKIRLFTKSYCVWCLEVMGWLNQHELVYQTLDVTKDQNAWNEMVALSGQTHAPVIEADGQILADFGVEELTSWWQERGFSLPNHPSDS